MTKIHKKKGNGAKGQTETVMLQPTKSLSTANRYSARIKQMLKLAVHEELVDPGVY